MKQILPIIALMLVFASCKSSKDYLSRSNEDRTFFDAIKGLKKKSSAADAAAALPELYRKAQDRHLARISSYQGRTDLAKWDKILESYGVLQDMYTAVMESPSAGEYIRAVNYYTAINTERQNAAEAYYNEGVNALSYNDRDNAKLAYTYFSKAGNFVANYRDSRQKMNEAFAMAVVKVVINPVQDNSFFFNTGWGNTGYNYSNEYFQQTLVRDLNSNNSNRYPAQFYTDWDARRETIKPDWSVDLTLRNVDMPSRPTTYNNSYNRSKQIEVGRDTSGNRIYQTVNATVNVVRASYRARITMDVNVQDAQTRRNIDHSSVSEDYNWTDETATYYGDSRALNNEDLQLINRNNRYNNFPARNEVLQELYRKIYPQVKNKILYAVDW